MSGLYRVPLPSTCLIVYSDHQFYINTKHFHSFKEGFTDTGVSGGVKFGAWGYYASDIASSVFGLRVGPLSWAPHCSPAQIRHKIDNRLLKLLQIVS
ncbi:hypothetical protein RSOLAG1IB_11866 [Rhizoctonia solani AG-1 IB]|uniref:Uncharacterized protein n=1 Tax=Thanatephorus cucumeris (strain AG1-IB / isolate 7/3/14) TaxID=1108050 RepID=A0A0B7FJ59_THACB|nr:hypothetical protein RSOLAG1IB_11866 [Rhizoctonia solani AG-1 IB]